MEMNGGAIFDRTRRYRYKLWRTWDENLPLMAFLMLNPSKADHVKNDQTIRTCISIARRFGFGSIEVVNLFAFCATYPDQLRAAKNPVGKENDVYIIDALHRSTQMLLAWGNHGRLKSRSREVLDMVSEAEGELVCLGKTKSGEPRHPLYVSAAAPLLPFFNVGE